MPSSISSYQRYCNYTFTVETSTQIIEYLGNRFVKLKNNRLTFSRHLSHHPAASQTIRFHFKQQLSTDIHYQTIDAQKLYEPKTSNELINPRNGNLKFQQQRAKREPRNDSKLNNPSYNNNFGTNTRNRARPRTYSKLWSE